MGGGAAAVCVRWWCGVGWGVGGGGGGWGGELVVRGAGTGGVETGKIVGSIRCV